MYLKNIKIEVAKELKEFDKVLSQESAQLQQQVKSEISNFRFVSKQFLRKFPPAVRLAKKLFRRRKSDKPILIKGKEGGFNNVLECAGYLASNFLQK